MNVPKPLISKALKQSFDYENYLEQMRNFMKNKATSGVQQTEELISYTKLNQVRMKRLTKTTQLNDAIINTLGQLNDSYTWLILTESWCGDAAQSLPILNKIAEQSDLIDLKIAYRDENSELMQYFLTNGGEAIPKLIVINQEQKVLADWGPRPSTVSKMVKAYKEKYGKLQPEFKEQLQVWYNKNKGADIIDDINVILLNIILQYENVILNK
ncbi:thioredoxin family protein [Ochrovirga pacifica]|uniref:thioredoxin family protein n=1 Tax=Ochrovirga pacifica TaxID=1042376 RepID=UPI000255A010|nr:thioredoxin family protein [Ochrovirga pacifica]